VVSEFDRQPAATHIHKTSAAASRLITTKLSRIQRRVPRLKTKNQACENLKPRTYSLVRKPKAGEGGDGGGGGGTEAGST
jgi:hypothetical protein